MFRIILQGFEDDAGGEFEAGFATKESAESRRQEILAEYTSADDPLEETDIWVEEY